MKASDEMNDQQGQTSFENGRGGLDPFFEPRTMPANWDVSEIMSPANDRSSRLPATSQPDQAAFSHEPEGDTLPEWQGNPFPKLRTFPSFWDFS